MKFMLMLYADEKAGAEIPEDQMAAALETLGAYRKALEKAGAFVATSALAPTWDAKTVLNEGGELKVHDGPYADTREQLGGYFIIEVPDLDAAVEWARKCPAARWGPIEVRPYHPEWSPS